MSYGDNPRMLGRAHNYMRAGENVDQIIDEIVRDQLVEAYRKEIGQRPSCYGCSRAVRTVRVYENDPLNPTYFDPEVFRVQDLEYDCPCKPEMVSAVRLCTMDGDNELRNHDCAHCAWACEQRTVKVDPVRLNPDQRKLPHSAGMTVSQILYRCGKPKRGRPAKNSAGTWNRARFGCEHFMFKDGEYEKYE